MHPVRALFVAWPLSIAGVARAAEDASAPLPVDQVMAPAQTVAPRDPPPAEAPTTPAAAPSKPSSSRSSAGDMGAFAAQLGLRGVLQDVSGTDRDGTLGGAGFGGWLFANLGVGSLTTRMEFRSHLGGSGGGIDGQYGLDLSFGGRLRLGDHAALLGRLGASGHILGNGRLLWWGIALPETDLGLQVADGRFFFEATGLGGITLGGNYLVGEEGQRKLGTAPHLGGRATLGLRPLVATVTWRHIFEGQNEPATPLDSVDGGLCLVFAKVAGVAVCADGRVFKGAVGYPNGAFADSTVLYGGISLSLGAVVAGGGKDMDFKK